jgi:hypothetical protein
VTQVVEHPPRKKALVSFRVDLNFAKIALNGGGEQIVNGQDRIQKHHFRSYCRDSGKGVTVALTRKMPHFLP